MFRRIFLLTLFCLFFSSIALAADVNNAVMAEFEADSQKLTEVKSGSSSYEADWNIMGISLKMKGTSDFNNGKKRLSHAFYKVTARLWGLPLASVKGESYSDDDSERNLTYTKEEKGGWEYQLTPKQGTPLANLHSVSDLADYKAVVKELAIKKDTAKERIYSFKIDGAKLGELCRAQMDERADYDAYIDKKDDEKLTAKEQAEIIMANLGDADISLAFDKESGYVKMFRGDFSEMMRAALHALVDREPNKTADEKAKMHSLVNKSSLKIKADLSNVNNVDEIIIPQEIIDNATEKQDKQPPSRDSTVYANNTSLPSRMIMR